MGVAAIGVDGEGQSAQREFLAGLRPGIALEIRPLIGPVGLAEPAPHIQPEISGQTVVQGFQLVGSSDAIRGEGCGEKNFLIHGKGPILSGEGSVFPEASAENCRPSERRAVKRAVVLSCQLLAWADT